MTRNSGILMHISSLPGERSCGSFGRQALRFIDFLAKAGFTYWQVLPFGVPDMCGSPYKSVSAFAGNPYFIDLDILHEKGLITKAELDGAKQKTPYSCEFPRLEKERMKLLLEASRRVTDKREVEEYTHANRHLDEFALFMAKKQANGGRPWWEWDEQKEADGDILFMYRFTQYEFFMQWKKVREYASAKNVKIIGDMPIYVDTDSSDVYFGRNNFLLDEKGRPTSVAGVPPDYFSPEGQLWGNPLYAWSRMKKDGYSWWKERMAHTMEMFDGVRIDHFRAFSAYYAVSADAENAKNGEWHDGPGLPFVKILKKVAGDGMIIAEDLGNIDEKVEKLVADSGFPGMRVFQFGFDGAGTHHRPHTYTENCVAYSGTHDNNTLLGYLWELNDGTRRFMLDYCGHDVNGWQSGCETIIRTIMRSSASLCIFPIQDILSYGSDTRMNTPGKPDGNWLFRVTEEQLGQIDTAHWMKLNGLYSRL